MAPRPAQVPPSLERTFERCAGPTLVFDRARLETNLRELADAARASGITALFAAKSFPHPEVWAMAARVLDGFDAASVGEVSALPPGRVLSIVDPSGRAAHAIAASRARVIVGCETAAQVAAAPAHAEIAIRLSASLTGRDPAVGAVLDGTGHRRSRFGLDVDPARRRAAIAEMVRAAAGRPLGLHVHHGPVTATTGARFVATAHAALTVAAEAELVPRFLDLGGAWHAVADLRGALAEVRAAVPAAIEVLVEPGRRITNDAGFACGHVLVARELDDRLLRIVDLSRICHLRWSQVELLGAAPRPGEGRSVLVAGPTCYEDDVLGEWTITPAHVPVGARVVLRNVTGYAVAWNTGFGGVPAADVVLA